MANSMIRKFLGIGRGTVATGDPPPPEQNPDAPVDDDPNNANDPDNQTARQQLRQNMQQVIDEDAADEMEGNSETAHARRRERARCATIFGDTAAADKPDLAAHLAFNTTLSRTAAIDALKAAPAGAKQNGLDAAMAGHAGNRPGLPPVSPQSAKSATEKLNAGWDDSFAAARSKLTRK